MGHPARKLNPRELEEAHEITVPAFSWGKTLHPSGDFDVTPEWYDKYREGFERLKEHRYFAPVLRQHKDDEGEGKEARKAKKDPRELEDGFIFGKIVDVLKDDEGIKHTLAVPKEVKEAYDKGYIDEWSPSFRQDWPHPHTGEVLELAPRHFAFVSNPHQKNLGPSSEFYSKYYSLSESDLTDGLIHDHSEDTMPKEQDNKPDTNAGPVDNAEGEQLQAISDKLDALTDLLTQFVEGQTEAEEAEEEEEVEMGEEDDPKVDALTKELAETRQQVKRLRAKQVRDKVRGMGIEDDEKVEELVELAEADPVEYTDRLAIELSEAKPKGQPTRLPEKGGTGSPDEPSQANPSLEPEEAIELAEAELKTTDEYKQADAAERARMKVRKARELRGEA